LARGHVFVDEGEDLRLDVRPGGGRVLCNGDVVGAEEDAGYAVNVEELGGERGWMWRGEGRAGVEVFEERGGDVFWEDALVGVEL